MANTKPFPENWCNTGRCSEPQKKIWNEFNDGGSPSWEMMPQVVSGSCYHSARYYSNETEHFSGFIIDKEANGLSFNGKHSFFTRENPYRSLNLITARESFKTSSPNRIEVFHTYGFYNANPGEERPVSYWFKEGSDKKIKMAVIYGSLDHFILCDLSYHNN